MQDDITSKVDGLAANGTKLHSFNVKVTYQSFIGDYGATGVKARALHIVIKCNSKVRSWTRFPIFHAEPFEEMIHSYIKSVLVDDMAKAADKTISEAQLAIARNDIALDFIEFSEGVRLEKSRIERVLAKGQEVIENRIAEEALQDQEKKEKAARLLAEYESLHCIWTDIRTRRRRDANLPIVKRGRVIQAVHESVPSELIKEFLIDTKTTPSDMALHHLVKLGRFPTFEAARKARARARKEIGDISEKRQMSPKK